MEKKGFMGKLKILSKPTGSPQWKLAARSIILMVLAVLIARYLGFDEGLLAVMFITLMATIIIDLPLPLRKIIPLALAGFLMTLLAFVSSSLALSSLPVFLFFTVVWAFFSISLYIFSETAGLFGFMVFTGYFMSVLLVNKNAPPLDWGLYIALSYLVASILFIPKLIHRKDDILKMVASPYNPRTPLEKVLLTRYALSGVPLSRRSYELFRMGTYLNGFRGYGELILSRLSGESKDIFQSFMEIASQNSLKIARSITNHENEFDLEPVDEKIVKLQETANDQSMNAVLDVAQDMSSLFRRVKELLAEEETSSNKLRIESPRNSLQEVLKANFNLRNMYIRHALRFTLAMTLGLMVVYLTHERSAIWVTMGILIIIKPDVTSTLNNMISRVSFNFTAILLAIALGFFFPHQMLVWIAFIMLFLFRAFYPTYMGLSVMAMTIFVVLVWPTGTVFENAVARIIDISIGAILAFICAYLILPSRMTVDLPGQIARTIGANREYVNAVIPSEDVVYNHEHAVTTFRKYMLEDKNLESAIKKVNDTFNDVGDDVSFYNELGATNRKLAADISALATLIESGVSLPNISRFKEQLMDALNELALSVDKSVVLPHANVDKYHGVEDVPLYLENYLDWIISDVKFIQEGVELGLKTGALKRYREMN
ncbi:hypothetical protein BK007_01430 [Methanobacterium subterraneum]|uniref:Integral membrane bound transporter domain-containing protein n=1 Tax=Methanobacterium subterraneum TaxID=59277 RepID=A0A2H4V9P1_9EURY|nr:FUSC family protein [Methanobacterium subterraneum]AUB54807.1 hypothetical protein BK007_01430 [Methanobacterium subterraneum]PKL73263.1 MAG: hypothetical protein CVV29_04430 [Methanobacteriales archaeon HGW-Methanobacteriales-2]